MKKHVKKLYGNVQKPPDEMNLHILVIITDWNYNKYVIKLLKEMHIPFQFLNHATGSAQSELLYLMGLGSPEKAMIHSVISNCMVKEIIKRLDDELGFNKPGKGVAFSVPLSGIGFSACRPVENDIWTGWQENMERKVNKMNENITHDLIIAVVGDGYSEDIMAVAKKAGAAGGTLIDASRVGIQEDTKFFGMEIPIQKDIVLILVEREDKKKIMEAISNCQLKTPKLVFSVPADNVTGMYNQEEKE